MSPVGTTKMIRFPWHSPICQFLTSATPQTQLQLSLFRTSPVPLCWNANYHNECCSNPLAALPCPSTTRRLCVGRTVVDGVMLRASLRCVTRDNTLQLYKSVNNPGCLSYPQSVAINLRQYHYHEVHRARKVSSVLLVSS